MPRCLFWVRWAVICFLLILKTPLSIRGMGDTTLTHPLGICQQLPPTPQVLLLSNQDPSCPHPNQPSFLSALPGLF